MYAFIKTRDPILVHKDYLYFPLSFDKDMYEELRKEKSSENIFSSFIRKFSGDNFLIEKNQKKYVKAASLSSLIKSFGSRYPSEYESIQSELFSSNKAKIEALSNLQLDPFLDSLVFEAMPRFVKINEGFSREAITRSKVVEYVYEKLGESAPAKAYSDAMSSLNKKSLKLLYENIASSKKSLKRPEGFVQPQILEEWIRSSIEQNALLETEQKLKEHISKISSNFNSNQRELAAMIYLNSHGLLFDGFGIKKVGDTPPTYLVYKNLKEYVLMDGNGTLYLMDPISVGVFCSGIHASEPFGLNNANHPFLPLTKTTQYLGVTGLKSVCMGATEITGSSAIEKTISALDSAINIILRGYTCSTFFMPHCSLSDSRGARRISENDPRLKDGTLEVTNSFQLKRYW